MIAKEKQMRKDGYRAQQLLAAVSQVWLMRAGEVNNG